MDSALAPGAVDLRYQPIDATDGAPGWLEVLSDAERARAARFRFDADRASFVAAHALLRATLSAHAPVAPREWSFAENAFGKPSIDGPHAVHGLAFNLTHTRGLVACAVCRGGDVGVDVEAVREDVDSLDIARRYFSERERAALEAAAAGDRPARFTEIWALKESYVKAIGHGLSHALDTFSFSLEREGRIGFAPPPDDNRAWRFALFAPAAQFRLAVALNAPASGEEPIAARGAGGQALAPLRS